MKKLFTDPMTWVLVVLIAFTLMVSDCIHGNGVLAEEHQNTYSILVASETECKNVVIGAGKFQKCTTYIVHYEIMPNGDHREIRRDVVKISKEGDESWKPITIPILFLQ